MSVTLDDTGLPAPTKSRKQTLGIPSRETTLAQHWLRNDAGQWLHFSGEGVTTERAYRWRGSPEQAKNLRATHPFAVPFKLLIPVT